MTKIVEKFKDRLNAALLMTGMKPSELAKKTGISEATISQYRSGYSQPKDKRLGLIAEVLRVDPSWLKGFDVPMNDRSVSLYDSLLITAKENDLINALGLFEPLSEEDRIRRDLVSQIMTIAKGMNEQGLQKLLDYAEDIKDKHRKE